MAVHSFRRIEPSVWEGVDLAALEVYVLQWDVVDWTLDVFTGAETDGDPWIWGDHYATLEEALSDVPALPEACADLLRSEYTAREFVPPLLHSGPN